MAIRNMIKIDEDKCNGCGQCIVDCAEGALAIVDGKAKLIKESFCDGLGACIGNCPTGALTLEKREAPEFELPEGAAHVAVKSAAVPAHPPASPPPGPCPSGLAGAVGHAAMGGCPGSRMRQFNRQEPESGPGSAVDAPSALGHWPIQLHLMNVAAPQFQGADLLFAADCTAFACGSFHPSLLKGKAVAIACPKLDDPSGYMEKLTALFRQANPRSVTVARMEVPCCRGISQWVLAARNQAESSLPVEEIVIGVEGAVIQRNTY